MTQKITPHLWFSNNAEEAVTFYTSTFNNGKVLSQARYTEAGKEIHKQEPGSIMTMGFEVEGYKFLALNGGPVFKLTPAISFIVMCPSAEDVDMLFNKLSEGGTVLMSLNTYPFSPRYGWTNDKFGVSWQIICMGDSPVRKIMPSLMFTGEKAGCAKEAIDFYTSVFKDSKVGMQAPYGPGKGKKEDFLMYADFILEGQMFAAMESGGPHNFTFNEAVSLLVTCKDQEEIDRLWEALSAVPASEQCGWLKDKYGVSWQIVPDMGQFFSNPDKSKANKAMSAMMQMKKIDIAKLKEAGA